MLDRLLSENITDIADWRFAIAGERARIRYVAMCRGLDDWNSELVHIEVKMMAIGVMTEVVN